MSIVNLQKQSGALLASTAPLTISLSTTNTGDFMVVGVMSDQITDVVTSVSTPLNTFTKIGAGQRIDTNGLGFISMYYCKNITGETTPTLTIAHSGTANLAAVMFGYSGVDRVSPLDKSSYAGATATTAVSSGATATLTGSNDLVVAFGGSDFGNNTYTVGATYGNLTQVGNVNVDAAMEDKILAGSTAAQTGTFTITASDNAGAVATFQAAGQTTVLGSLFDTTSGNHTVTATPAVGDLIVIVEANSGSTATVAPTDNNSDLIGTYTLVTSVLKNTSADVMNVWVRNFPIGSATSTVFTSAPGTTTGGGLIVYKHASVTMNYGLAAIRQSATQANQAAAGTPAPVFANAALTNSIVINAVFNGTNPAGVTVRTGYTSDVNTGYITPTNGFISTHKDSTETGTTQTWGGTSASAFSSVAVEIDTSSPIPAITNLRQYDSDGVTPMAVGQPSYHGANEGVILEYDMVPSKETLAWNKLQAKFEAKDVSASFANAATNATIDTEYDPDGPIPSRGAGFCYDTTLKRFLMFGGANGSTIYNNVHELKFINGKAKWRRLHPTGTAPTARYQGAAVYDAVNNRLLTVFGFTTVDTNEIWSLSFATNDDGAWTQLTASTGTPPVVMSNITQSVCNDPVRKCFYIVFGWGAAFHNGVYKFDYTTVAGAWSTIGAEAAAGAPTARRNANAIYDSVKDRIITTFGNINTTTGTQNDLKAFSLASNTWSSLTPTGGPPSVRERAWGAYDPNTQKAYFGMGDNDNTAAPIQDYWQLDCSTTNCAWTQKDPTATSVGYMPTGTYLANAQFDPDQKLIVIYNGGVDITADLEKAPQLIDTTETTPVLYSALQNDFMNPRDATSSIYNPDTGESLAFGGYSQMDDNTTIINGGHVNDVYAYSVSSSITSGPFNGGTAADVAGSAAWVNPSNATGAADGSFATNTGSGGASPGDILQLTNFGFNIPSNAAILGVQVDINMQSSNTNTKTIIVELLKAGVATGSNLATTTVIPGSLGYVTFGGSSNLWGTTLTGADVNNSGFGVELQVGAIAFATFQASVDNIRITVTYQIPSWRVAHKGNKGFMIREGIMGAYDTNNGRYILFGGLWGTGGVAKGTFNDVWEAKRDANGNYGIRRLSPTGTLPGSRWLGACAFDQANNRLLVTCGSDGGAANFNDLWQLSFTNNLDGAWTLLSPTGTPPVATWGPGYANDTANKILYYMGGATSAGDTTYSAQFLKLDYSTAACVWTALSTGSGPSARRSMGMGVDHANNKVIVFGGYGGALQQDINFYDITGNTWSGAATPGTSPGVRRSHGAWYDPTNARFMITHGRQLSGTIWWGDTWELNPNYVTPASSTWVNKNPTHYIRGSAKLTGLANNAQYHWQGWLTDNSAQNTNTGMTSFGGNAESSSDFSLVAAIANTIQVTSKFVGSMAQRAAFRYRRPPSPIVNAPPPSTTGIIQAYAGGGGGGGDDSTSTVGGTGGGGGAFSQLNAYTLFSATPYTVTVGGSGSQGSHQVSGGQGGDSWFDTNTAILAKGGGGGGNGNSPTPGTGGAAGSGIGDTKHTGGNGSTLGSRGGGGGGAGTANDGATPTTASGGAGGAVGGGNGGAGVPTGNGSGTAGSTYGGAGGGAIGGGNTGGAGAAGAVIIQVLLGQISSATGGVHTTDATYDYWTFTTSGTWTPTIGGSNHFTSSLTGGLSFIGAQVKSTSYPLSGALSFIGNLIKRTSRALTGGLSFVGNQTRRITRPLTGSLSFVGSTPTRVINRTLTGALSFSGALTRVVSRNLTGSLSFVGNLTRQVARSLTGALSFVGNLATITVHHASLTGSLSFSGAFSKTTNKVLAGALSFIGAVQRVVSRSMTASLSFVGNVTRAITGVNFTGALSFVGSFAKTTSRKLVGSLSFVGNIVKQPGKTLTGALSFSGGFIKQTVRSLTGALSFSGALATIKTLFRTVTGSLSFSGSITKSTNYPLTGALSFIGSLNRQLSRTLIGSLSFAGALTRLLARNLSGSLSFVGTLARQGGKALSGSLSFIGSQTRQINKGLTASLSFIGSKAVKFLILGKANFAASLSFSGSIAKSTARALTGALSFVGNIPSRVINKTLTATLSFSGVLSRVINRTLTASLTFSGNLLKSTARSLTGALSFVGNFVSSRAFLRTVTGSLSFIGNFNKQTNYPLSGALSFVGSINRQVGHLLSAALSFSGSLVKSTTRSLTASLNFVGSLTKQSARILTASLSFSGNLTRRIARSLTAALSFSGSLTRSILKTAFTASLSFSGNLARQVVRSLTAATLSFSGALSRQSRKPLTGALSFTGSLSRQTNKFLTASLSFVGSLNRFITKGLTASLSFVGNLFKQASRAFTGSLNFSGAFTASKSFLRAVTGSLSFSGAIQRQNNKVLSGALTFVGSISRASTYLLTASLSFVGSLAKLLTRTLTGATLSFSGAIAKQSNKTFAGALTFSGAISRQVRKVFTASLTFIGSLTRSISHALTGSLSFVGNTAKQLARTLTGSLSFSGVVAGSKAFLRSITGNLSFSGAFSRSTNYPLSGSLSFVGSMTRRIARTFTASLTFVGSITKRISRSLTAGLTFSGAFSKRVSRSLTGSLSFIGNFTKNSVFVRAFTASVGFSGSITRRVSKQLSATLAFSGSIVKRISRSLSAGLSFIGNWSRVKSISNIAFTATLGFTGSMITKAVKQTFITFPIVLKSGILAVILKVFKPKTVLKDNTFPVTLDEVELPAELEDNTIDVELKSKPK